MGGSRGRRISGWLPVDKPSGITSADVVHHAKRALGAAKAGHAGTLDKPATGLLAIAFGEATKTIPFITDAFKCYRFEIRFGIATETDDASGTPIATSDLRPDTDSVLLAVRQFRGLIEQVPPDYSSVHVDGKRAYRRAAAGEALDLPARSLHVRKLELIERRSDDLAEFEMVCGKGGYVRSIARDLGQFLGCYGHVHRLRRIWSGPFNVDDAVSLEALSSSQDREELDKLILPLESALADQIHYACSDGEFNRVRNGNPISALSIKADENDTVWLSHAGRAVAIAIFRHHQLFPKRIIHGIGKLGQT